VEQIESRRPQTKRKNDPPIPLIEEADFNTAYRREGFAYEFLRQAKRPDFRFIAPGLEILTTISLMEKPFVSLIHDTGWLGDRRILSEEVESLPLLLFRAVNNEGSCDAAESSDNPLFGWPFSLIRAYPAGLYLSCVISSAINAFEDECTLVLPYRIGSNGYARTSDNAVFGENRRSQDTHVEAKDTCADIYQPGYQPFIVGHPVTLLRVLKSWITMVQRGEWQINEDGVMGGIEEWKKADTEEHWQKYVLPVHW
jgi:hypothetical protein